jgi:hypothetical protein
MYFAESKIVSTVGNGAYENPAPIGYNGRDSVPGWIGGVSIRAYIIQHQDTTLLVETPFIPLHLPSTVII